MGHSHRAGDIPEGVPAGRQTLDDLAVDDQQGRLVGLDQLRDPG